MFKVTVEEVIVAEANPHTYNRERTVYTQYVKDLDLRELIKTVNALPKDTVVVSNLIPIYAEKP